MPTLALDNLTMAYGPRVLFQDVCAEIGPAETLIVTGTNGSGKSTLLKIVAGLLRPEEGRVLRHGTLGYAAPDVNLYSELTGFENLTFFSRLRGVLPDPAQLLDHVGLPRRSGREMVANYSTGMRHRLKLAASLIGEPDLLIWDEPTMSLDESGAARVNDALERHRRQGRIAVIATNNADEADRWSRAGAKLHLGCA